MANPVLLNQKELTDQLARKGFSQAYRLHLFDRIDSTNRYLKDLPPSSILELCCAELQTQGRGRFGRHWHSPYAENIYFSSRWSFNSGLNKLSGLSLICSLAIKTTLIELEPQLNIKIKWPNDLLWEHRKLAGTLVELLGRANDSTQVLIGIGLNVNSDTKTQPLHDKAWCSLFDILKKTFDRTSIVTNLLIQLDAYLSKFLTQGLGGFLKEWSEYDYLLDKKITVNQLGTALSGTAKGINQSGELLVEDDQGVQHCFSSGDTTVRPKHCKILGTG